MAWLSGLSTGTAIVVGIVLMVLGVVVIAFGVGGGIAKMIKDLRGGNRVTGGLDPVASLEKLLTAVTQLLKTLITAPEWLALVAVGFALVGAGVWVISAP